MGGQLFTVAWCLSAACLLAACDGPPVVGPDGGATSTVAQPMPPAPAARPTWGPCPTGWRQVAVEGTSVCEPWAEDAAPTCAPGELALPGVGCDPIDTCPADGWPSDLPTTGVVYVRAGATGGDGTRAAPFGTPAEGLNASHPGDTVALAVGAYDGPIYVVDRQLRGACATGTIVRNPGTTVDDRAIYLGRGGSARGLHAIAGNFALQIGFDVTGTSGRELWLEAPYGALQVDPNGAFEGDRIRIDGTTLAGVAASNLCGLSLRNGSATTLRHLSGTTAATFFSCGYRYDDETPVPITLTIEDSSVADVDHVFSGRYEEMTLRRSTFERTAFVVGSAPGCVAEVEDVVVRDIGPRGAAPQGGALTSIGGVLHARRVLGRRLDATLLAAFAYAPGMPGTIEASDILASETHGPVLVACDGRSTVTLARVQAVGIASNALSALGHCTITVNDMVVETRPRDGLPVGDVVDAFDGSQVVVSNLEARVGRVLVLANSSARVTLNDTDAMDGSGAFAQCLAADAAQCAAEGPSTVLMNRAYLHDMGRTAFAVSRGAGELHEVDIDGVVVVDDVSAAISVHGQLSAERVRVRHAGSRAVVLFGDGTTVSVADLTIDGVTSPCADASCGMRWTGDGITCALGASATVERADIRGAARAGVVLVDDCLRFDVVDGLVTGNEIGVLTDTGGATGATLERVRVEGNVNDYNTTELTLTPPMLEL